MSKYKSIQITENTKQKLDLCKGINNLSYNNIIENLLAQSGGTIVEDVITITREHTAFILKYFDNMENCKTRDVTFKDLHDSKPGDVFKVIEEPIGDGWVNSKATVINKLGSMVILLVEEFNDDTCIKSVVHVELF